MSDLSNPAIARVVEVASRKGVKLDIRYIGTEAETAAQAAAAVEAEVGQIVKTVVFVATRPDGRLSPIVCLVSGGSQVDPRLLAAVTGETSVRPASAREARELSGFAMGAIPPIGHQKGIRVFMDQELCPYQWVWAPAGTDSYFFRITPGTLRMLANALVAPIAAAPWVASTIPQVPFLLEVGSGA